MSKHCHNIVNKKYMKTIDNKTQKRILLDTTAYMFNENINKMAFCKLVKIHISSLSRYLAFGKPNFEKMSVAMQARFEAILYK